MEVTHGMKAIAILSTWRVCVLRDFGMQKYTTTMRSEGSLDR